MDEATITGIFTLLGAVLGFLISKISDFITEWKDRKNNKILLILKLSALNASLIKPMRIEIEKNTIAITKSSDLFKINAILKASDATNEVTRLVRLYEKSIPINIKNVDLYADFDILIYQMHALIFFIDRRVNQIDQFPDQKQYLIESLDKISKHIDIIMKNKIGL
jgi:hypothetical protein